MGGHRLLAATVATVLLLGACGDDDTGTADPAPTSEATSSTTTAPEADGEPVLDEEELDLGPLMLTFANLTYDVRAGVVTNQELRSYVEGTEVVVGDTHHLVLDVVVTNDTGRQLESDEDAIRLRVDGADVPFAQPFLSDAAGFLRAGSSVESFLAFEVDADFDPADASVVFGRAPDRPAELPLTGPVPEDAYPIELEVTGTASGVGPTNGGTIEFEVVGATAFVDLPHGDTTSPTGERADDDELFLQVHIRATKVEGRGNDVLVDAFRLVEDGLARAPFDVATSPTGSTPSPTAEPGATVDAWVLVLITPGAETYELQVGATEEDPGSIPLDLAALAG